MALTPGKLGTAELCCSWVEESRIEGGSQVNALNLVFLTHFVIGCVYLTNVII